jgi:ketosteroid isomerase-like protein
VSISRDLHSETTVTHGRKWHGANLQPCTNEFEEDVMVAKKKPIQQMTDAFDAMISHGDLDAIISLFREDATFEEPDILPYGGVFRGEQIRSGFLGMMAYWDDIEFVMPRMIDGGNVIVSILPFSARSKSTGIAVKFDITELWEFDDADNLVRVRIFYIDMKKILEALGISIGTNLAS